MRSICCFPCVIDGLSAFFFSSFALFGRHSSLIGAAGNCHCHCLIAAHSRAHRTAGSSCCRWHCSRRPVDSRHECRRSASQPAKGHPLAAESRPLRRRRPPLLPLPPCRRPPHPLRHEHSRGARVPTDETRWTHRSHRRERTAAVAAAARRPGGRISAARRCRHAVTHQQRTRTATALNSVTAMLFHCVHAEFVDPLLYIQSIRAEAQLYGQPRAAAPPPLPLALHCHRDQVPASVARCL